MAEAASSDRKRVTGAISGLRGPGSSWICTVALSGKTVRARIYNPQSRNGSRADTRTGILDLRLRAEDLDRLDAPALALTIVTALEERLAEMYLRPTPSAERSPRPKAPPPLDRGHGVEHVAGQLRLDLLR